MKRILGWIAMAAVLSAARVALAASSGLRPSETSVIPSIMRLGLALGGVVALVYLVAFLLRRSRNGVKARSNHLMNVVEVLPLGPKSRLVAVRVGERILVVGAGESSVNPVAELGEDEAEPLLETGTHTVIPFRERLLRLAGK